MCVQLSENNFKVLVVTEDSSVVLNQLEVNEQGIYRCTLQDREGTVLSQATFLLTGKIFTQIQVDQIHILCFFHYVKTEWQVCDHFFLFLFEQKLYFYRKQKTKTKLIQLRDDQIYLSILKYRNYSQRVSHKRSPPLFTGAETDSLHAENCCH